MYAYKIPKKTCMYPNPEQMSNFFHAVQCQGVQFGRLYILDTNVSTVGGKPPLKDKKISKTVLPNISNPGQSIGVYYPWETARTENNQPS